MVAIGRRRVVVRDGEAQAFFFETDPTPPLYRPPSKGRIDVYKRMKKFPIRVIYGALAYACPARQQR
jgi:hypothetical protein